ncbi:TetR/AcrR family transcriptional regulator [Nocardia fluminea]|uniref:TetR family transcriptional regulator n=1 Tax=Nocardia fluminea TaxID=134984 RepID=A0A2N3VK93_9NOCA|nr:TetR/AcrR family transcriptional regulator [Nocardia fluminea]PKV82034.1 TetR family transcriptional regulator [Nocardia fluminea]
MNDSEASGRAATGRAPGRTIPRTKRGERKRAALVAAAREIFERDGYLDARIADISEAAGAASGSFYTYFDGKDDVFAALVEQARQEMLHPHIRERTGVADPRQLIYAANREYLLAYEKNARLMAVFEEAELVNAEFRRLRLERARSFVLRNEKMIRALQQRGQASADLDPLVAAQALSAMVSRMASVVFLQGQPIEFESLVTTLTQLWVNALQLKPS